MTKSDGRSQLDEEFTRDLPYGEQDVSGSLDEEQNGSPTYTLWAAARLSPTANGGCSTIKCWMKGQIASSLPRLKRGRFSQRRGLYSLARDEERVKRLHTRAHFVHTRWVRYRLKTETVLSQIRDHHVANPMGGT